MQLWAVRSCGGSWRVTVFEIVGCGDDRHVPMRGDAGGDHVLGHLFAEADAGVVAVLDDVDEAVFDVNFDLDVGILRGEPVDEGPEDGAQGMFAGIDPDGAGRGIAIGAEGFELGIDLVEARGDGGQEALAGLGRGDAAGGPREEPDTEPLFQVADGAA